MYLLDTNIISLLDPDNPRHTADLSDWIVRNSDGLFLSAMTIAELEAGHLRARRRGYSRRVAMVERVVRSIRSLYETRILPFDLPAADHVASLGERTHRKPVPVADLIIAATANRFDLILLTDNVKDFARTGVRMHNPLVSLPPDI